MSDRCFPWVWAWAWLRCATTTLYWSISLGESPRVNPNVVFGLMNVGFAVLLIALSVPLVLRKVRMNYLYGVRIRKAFESEANWYAINEYGGKQLILWSLPMVLAGFVCLVFPLIHDPGEPMAFLVGVGPVSICLTGAIWRILRFSRRLS